jgi:hypothetical protein
MNVTVGATAVDDAVLRRGVAAAFGAAPSDVALAVALIHHDPGSPGTGGVWRVDAVVRGEPRAVVAKLVHHPRHWPRLGQLPPDQQEVFLDYFPWRFELDLHRAGVGDLLPPGLRTPALHHVDELDADHLMMYWECIEERAGPWVDADYAAVAAGLGRFAARRRAGAPANDRLPPACYGPVPALRYYVEGAVLRGALPAVREPGLWAHPALTAAVAAADVPGGSDALRARLVALGERLPALLDEVEALPQAFAHGDASPQNLLADRDEPGSYVVIDWGFGTLLPVGFDLGQLVVGSMHAGRVDPYELHRLAELVVPPYWEGCRTEGFDVAVEDVQLGFVGGLALRSTLTAIPLEDLTDDVGADQQQRLVDRVRLTVRLLDLVERLPAADAAGPRAAR